MMQVMMNLISAFAAGHAVAFTLLALSVVCVLGLALGNLRVKGIGLGVAGVLFAGIAVGHLGVRLDGGVLKFARDLGLVLFVFTVGMQIGPGFFNSLKQQGLALNGLALLVVGLGALLAIWIGHGAGFSAAATAGLFSGATTNTPSLGAAQEALRALGNPVAGASSVPALAYAAAYPFGIVGIILSMLLLRAGFGKFNAPAAAHSGEAAGGGGLERLNCEITNPDWVDREIRQIPELEQWGVVISRVLFRGNQTAALAHANTVLRLGDIVMAVGLPERLRQFEQRAGRRAGVDLMHREGPLGFRQVFVTHAAILGKSLREMGLEERYKVTATRLTRGEVEMPMKAGLPLLFGDRLQLVGEEGDLDRAAEHLGNAIAELRHLNFLPIFLGIALGLLLGSLPLPVWGLPAPVSLGLAGGPLVAAILLSRLPKFGPLVWYLPTNANLALRELGILLFLACVGLKAGGHFVEVLIQGEGWRWMAWASLITMVPLLVAGGVARVFLRLSFGRTCGVLAGTMTDPPALAFAGNLCASDEPAVAYATVYPFTMLLRILAAQLIVLCF